MMHEYGYGQPFLYQPRYLFVVRDSPALSRWLPLPTGGAQGHVQSVVAEVVREEVEGALHTKRGAAAQVPQTRSSRSCEL